MKEIDYKKKEIRYFDDLTGVTTILEKDKKTAYWLSQNIASCEPSEWYDKYDDYKNPSLSEILEWFMQYCKYEKSKV